MKNRWKEKLTKENILAYLLTLGVMFLLGGIHRAWINIFYKEEIKISKAKLQDANSVVAFVAKELGSTEWDIGSYGRKTATEWRYGYGEIITPSCSPQTLDKINSAMIKNGSFHVKPLLSEYEYKKMFCVNKDILVIFADYTSLYEHCKIGVQLEWKSYSSCTKSKEGYSIY